MILNLNESDSELRSGTADRKLHEYFLRSLLFFSCTHFIS